jgi:hypothetical protein
MSKSRNSGVESDAGAIYDATKAAQDLEKEKSKSKVKFGPETSDANNESGETDDERNASGFAPPSGKNRTKKRQHVAGSGVTPEPKEARYTSAYKDGNKIERTPAQIKATAMAVEDRARREKSGLLAAGRRPRPRGSGLGGGDLGNNSSDGGSDNGRVSYGGRGRGRGNGRNFDGNKSRSISFNSKTKAGSAANNAAGSAAQNSKNRPQAPVRDTCTDLNPGLDSGLTSNTKVKLYSQDLKNKYLPSKYFTDYTTALHRMVSYPKLIKLGSTGSSTRRCGAAKKFKYTKNSKYQNNFQKIKILKFFKSITKLTARALVITLKCNNFFPIKIGQGKLKFFTKLFDINLEMAMFKTAIRTTIGRPNQKLGTRKHISTYKFLNHARKSKHKLKHKVTSSTKFNNNYA